MSHPELNDYLKLFELYAGRLDFTVTGDRSGDYTLLFQQVMRLMQRRSPFNAALPAPFLTVARRYAAGETATVAHFGYNENRRFLLSDLHDFLQLQLMRDRRRP